MDEEKGGDIINDLQLTAVELFFLGRIINARYVEYAYISDMPDIQIGFGKQRGLFCADGAYGIFI